MGDPPLYLLGDEFAAEIANRTVRAVMHAGWVPDGSGAYRGQLAVLVKPDGMLGAGYMAAIKPFRNLIVYPRMMRDMGRRWRRRRAQSRSRSRNPGDRGGFWRVQTARRACRARAPDRVAARSAGAQHPVPDRLRGRVLRQHRPGPASHRRAVGQGGPGRRPAEGAGQVAARMVHARPAARIALVAPPRAWLGDPAPHAGLRPPRGPVAHRDARRTAFQARAERAPVRHLRAAAHVPGPRYLGEGRARSPAGRQFPPGARRPAAKTGGQAYQTEPAASACRLSQ